MKIDLHIHSQYSWDSRVPIRAYISRAEQLGFGAISICDHNSIDSHSEIEKLQGGTEVILVPGQEISTADGHLLVYGWVDQIDEGLSMRESVKLAKQQGGYCIAAHPYDPLRGGSFSKVFKSGIDGIEILNASAWLGIFNYWAKRGLEKHGRTFSGLANSDSHKLVEFGTAFTLIKPASTINEVLNHLASAHIGGGRIGLVNKLKRFVQRKIG